jgi:hypothetical protein
MEDKKVETHPVQTPQHNGRCPKVVTMRAYEAYCKVYAPQEELITGGCRGGFSVGELIGFLYAHTFPENEWRVRFDEAITGMENMH